MTAATDNVSSNISGKARPSLAGKLISAARGVSGQKIVATRDLSANGSKKTAVISGAAVTHKGSTAATKTVEDPTVTESLINLVREREPLWNFRDESLVDRQKDNKAQLWKDICNLLPIEITVEQVKSKWKNLKDTYASYKKRLRKTSGSSRKAVKEWKYAKFMDFLDDIDMDAQQTQSNIEQEEEELGEKGGDGDGDETVNETDENSCPNAAHGEPPRKRRSKTKEEALDRLAEALHSTGKAAAASSPLPPQIILPQAPPPPDFVESFLLMIGHCIKGLPSVAMQREVVFHIHKYLHEFSSKAMCEEKDDE